MFKRFVTTSGKRSLKKLPRRVKEALLEATRILETNPYAGEQLSGPLNFLYSFHFKFEGVEYRVAYTLNTENKQITIHFAETRENFYEKLRRLFR